MKLADHAVATNGKAHLAYYIGNRSFSACNGRHLRWSALWDTTTDLRALIAGPHGCALCRAGLAAGKISLKL